MPVDRINKVHETPVIRERPEITSQKEKKHKKKKDKGKNKKRKGIVDIMA
ncbi:hypothetical protein MNBD_NITROSPIRAE02-1436 [hydrothermal vent metagenome]|uniref:Uncharacterized protein n=1 Tax=hydrothermal vent metagenome TaxID=652676 RepID=A0A3B1DRU0_9ZZZZ